MWLTLIGSIPHASGDGRPIGLTAAHSDGLIERYRVQNDGIVERRYKRGDGFVAEREVVPFLGHLLDLGITRDEMSQISRRVHTSVFDLRSFN